METDLPRKRSSFFFLPIRVLWQSLLLFLIPSTIAILIVVPLMLWTKSAHIEMWLVTSNITFSLVRGWQSGQDVEFLKSAPAREVKVWIDSIEVDAEELIEERRKAHVLREDRVSFRRRDEDSWVAFRSLDGELTLASVYVGRGSKVALWRRSKKIGLVLEPNGQLEGKISFAGFKVSMYVYNYEIVRANGEPLLNLPPSPQQRFLLRTEPTSLVFSSSKKVKVEVDLARGDDKDFPGTFSEYLRVKAVRFLPGSGEAAVPIKEGWVRFRNLEKAQLDLQSDFVKIPEDDVLDLVTIRSKSGALELLLSGDVDSLRIGKAPEPEGEMLPSLLEWLYHHQKLGIIIGALVWLSGTILGAVNLLDALKRSGV
jgi:hypothetical protein